MSTTDTALYTLKIGARFFFDYASRDLVTSSGEPSDYILKVSKNRSMVTVRLSLKDMNGLLSDALYYAIVGWGGNCGGLGKSAAATARKVTAALTQAGI